MQVIINNEHADSVVEEEDENPAIL